MTPNLPAGADRLPVSLGDNPEESAEATCSPSAEEGRRAPSSGASSGKSARVLSYGLVTVQKYNGLGGAGPFVEKRVGLFPGEELREFSRGVWVTSFGRVFGRKVGLSKGYSVFNVKRVSVPVHRAVAQLFIPNPDSLPLVRHLNDVKSDNRASNLAWGNTKDNRADADRNGSRENKLSRAIVRAVRELAREGYSYADLARVFGVHRGVIRKAATGQTWRGIVGSPPLSLRSRRPEYSVGDRRAIAHLAHSLGSSSAAARHFSCSVSFALKCVADFPALTGGAR